MVTCTNDNCPSPSYDQCYFFKARKLAQKTDLSVINHHLLFADLAMKEDGFSDFLPEAEVFIIDEAHQIPDIATQFFGKSIGTIEIERFIKELLLKAIVLNEAKTIKSMVVEALVVPNPMVWGPRLALLGDGARRPRDSHRF